MPAAILSVGDSVRRVVDGLLRGACGGRFLCSRCLVKLTRDHLDRRHPTGEVALAIADLFRAPGRMTHLALRGVRGTRDAVPRGADPVSLPYTTEGFIRRAVGGVLDGTYRGRGVCSACLVGMTLERLHRGWRRSEVELAMDKVFKAPAPLGDMPAGPCGRCRRPTPCLRGGPPARSR
jgi:hypothetical protein